MEYLRDTTDFKLNNTAVTFGKFDGFHIGHRYLIEQIKKTGNLETVVFTFDMSLINFGTKENILSKTEKEELYEELGVDYVIEYPFTKAVKDMSAKEFIEEVVVGKLSARVVAVGNDFRFGKDGSGDAYYLENVANNYGFDVIRCDKIMCDEETVSSTAIRNYISAADFSKAGRMLGYNYFVSGIVTEGKKLGRTIGFPTINILVPQDKITPPNGVYATRIDTEYGSFFGISNIGVNPTVKSDDKKILETHMFDFDGNMYGKYAKVTFLSFVRKEKRFDGVEALRKLIDLDVKSVKEKICVDKDV